MTELPNYAEVARRYGLEPIPESVLRLAQLVSRQEADLDEIAALIKKDPALSRRILRLANPHTVDEGHYEIKTVEQALMRHGVGCALLLAMGAPLSEALVKTFLTMLSLKLECLEVRSVIPSQGDHLFGIIRFSGKATGQVQLRLGFDSAKQVAAKVLGLESANLEAAKDAVGELLNIMAGNFKSNLCDAGLECCRLEPPRVYSSAEFNTVVEEEGNLERMVFRAPSILMFVDARVNPWS